MPAARPQQHLGNRHKDDVALLDEVGIGPRTRKGGKRNPAERLVGRNEDGLGPRQIGLQRFPNAVAHPPRHFGAFGGFAFFRRIVLPPAAKLRDDYAVVTQFDALNWRVAPHDEGDVAVLAPSRRFLADLPRKVVAIVQNVDEGRARFDGLSQLVRIDREGLPRLAEAGAFLGQVAFEAVLPIGKVADLLQPGLAVFRLGRREGKVREPRANLEQLVGKGLQFGPSPLEPRQGLAGGHGAFGRQNETVRLGR